MSETKISRNAEIALVLQNQCSELLTLMTQVTLDSSKHYSDGEQEWYKNPELKKYRKDLERLYSSVARLRDRQELLVRVERLATLQ